MFGAFVPITTGQMPIDFRQQIIYNGFIDKKTLSKWRGASEVYQAAERVGMHSAAYKIPRAAEVAFSAGLNKSDGNIVKVQVLTEIISSRRAFSLLNRVSNIVYPP